MKKFVPIAMMVLFAVTAVAGTMTCIHASTAAFPSSVQSQLEHAKLFVPGDVNSKGSTSGNVESFNESNSASPFSLFRGDSVGITWWDAQTFNSMPNRCVNYANGSGTLGMIASTDNQEATLGTYIAVNGGSGFAPLGPNASSKWKSIQSDQRW